MVGLDEALETQDTQMAGANKTGVDQISYFQEIVFTKYVKLVLPADGFVFWVRADMLSASSVFDDSTIGEFAYDQGSLVSTKAQALSIKGSLHYAADNRQDQGENYAVNRVVFTAQDEVEDFNAIAPTELWLGTFGEIRFAFSSLSSFYQQAGLWHYLGDAVYADMETQIIDTPQGVDTLQVVSNSLPIWLSMNDWVAPPYLPFGNSIPLYPSYLAPDNIRPPFATVHVVPEATDALAAAPHLGRTLSHSQLARDRVVITFWGVRNDAIMTFVDFVNQFSLSGELLGVMNTPIVRDEKRTQSELNTIAIKKTIEYEVSYYQQSARDVARQLIKKALVTYYQS